LEWRWKSRGRKGGEFGVTFASFISFGRGALVSVPLSVRSVSCTGNRHPIPGDRALAVTVIGWHGTALGYRPPRQQLTVGTQNGVDV